MAIQTSNLGYPRIGLQREWKKHWKLLVKKLMKNNF